VSASRKVRFVYKPAGPVADHEKEVLRLLLNAESVDVQPDFAPARAVPSAHSILGDLFMPLDGLIDTASERARLTKERARMAAEIEKVQTKLDNPDFVQKVPGKVLEEHRQRLIDWQSRLKKVEESLESLGPGTVPMNDRA
jgi:valyl-tRNA synthetase